jgi:hypothetical protein
MECWVTGGRAQWSSLTIDAGITYQFAWAGLMMERLQRLVSVKQQRMSIAIARSWSDEGLTLAPVLVIAGLKGGTQARSIPFAPASPPGDWCDLRGGLESEGWVLDVLIDVPGTRHPIRTITVGDRPEPNSDRSHCSGCDPASAIPDVDQLTFLDLHRVALNAQRSSTWATTIVTTRTSTGMALHRDGSDSVLLCCSGDVDDAINHACVDARDRGATRLLLWDPGVGAVADVVESGVSPLPACRT